MEVSKYRRALELLTTAAVLVAAVSVVWVNLRPRTTAAPALPTRPTETLPKEPLSLGDAHVQGQWSAPVAMLIYSDFQCRYCTRFAIESLPTIRAEWVDTGKLLVGYKHTPVIGNAERGRRTAPGRRMRRQVWPVLALS